VRLVQPGDMEGWLSYRGQWGQPSQALRFQGGPASPGQQGDKWHSPLAWGESSVAWDEYAGHHIGKIRTHIDAPCNVGVRFGNGGQRFGWVFNEYREEIAGGEYVVNETRGTESLILHNTYKLPAWRYVFYITCPAGFTPSARQGGPGLTVEFYDDGRDELVTANYTLPANWTPETTIGVLELADPALPLAVDQDNDGATDAVVPPDGVTTEPVEPPVVGGVVFVPWVVR